jgi:hypothetical protein
LRIRGRAPRHRPGSRTSRRRRPRYRSVWVTVGNNELSSADGPSPGRSRSDNASLAGAAGTLTAKVVVRDHTGAVTALNSSAPISLLPAQ